MFVMQCMMICTFSWVIVAEMLLTAWQSLRYANYEVLIF